MAERSRCRGHQEKGPDGVVLQFTALFMFTVTIILLTFLGKFFFQCLHEAMTPINSDGGVR